MNRTLRCSLLQDAVSSVAKRAALCNSVNRSSLSFSTVTFFHSRESQQLPRFAKRYMATTTVSSSVCQDAWLRNAIDLVKEYDPAAYLPGRLLPAGAVRSSYFAIRGFWIETGLRLNSTARVPSNSPPLAHLDYWEHGIQAVFEDAQGDSTTTEYTFNPLVPPDFQHPTLLLLRDLRTRYQLPWEKTHFDNVLLGRRRDLDLKQYEKLSDMHQQAELSCGSLFQLILESAQMTNLSHPKAHEAARLVGIAHGLTNALRQSIPILSTTGKLVIPTELTEKYDIQSPRYLLSALAMGDEECHAKLQKAVADVCDSAHNHLMKARLLRNDVLSGGNKEQSHDGRLATHILLPGIISETFLQRLQAHNYDLTHRQLRHVGVLEHAKCAGRVVQGYLQSKY